MSYPSIGDSVADYVLEARLGEGGMGVVYRARQPVLDRLVALKLIRTDLADDHEFRARFRSESRTAAAINHPNVVAVYDAGEVDGMLYLAMQLVSGRDLGDVLACQGRLEPDEAIRIVAAAAAGLDAVHAAGLVHRDVKPGNILLGTAADEGRVLVTDFGLAQTIAASNRLTGTGKVIGTLDYVAPEQLQGERADARTDVYALACVLFHALTGAAPFADAETPAAKMYAHLNHERPRLAERGGANLGVLDPVIARGLARDPADRHPSAGDLGRAAWGALRRERRSEPERAVGTGAAALTATRPTRRRIRAYAALLVAAAVVGAAAVLVAIDPFSSGDALDPGSANGAAERGAAADRQPDGSEADATTGTTTTPGADGGGGGRSDAAPGQSDVPAPDPPAPSSPPAPSTPPASQLRARAVRAVERMGYTVGDPGTFEAGNELTALIGFSTGSIAGRGQRAFFFVDGTFAGTDTEGSNAPVTIVSQTGEEVALRYRLYARGEPLCCPSDAEVVRFRSDGAEARPLSAIPRNR